MDSNGEYGNLFAGTKLASKTHRLFSLLVNKEVELHALRPGHSYLVEGRKSTLRVATEISEDRLARGICRCAT